MSRSCTSCQHLKRSEIDRRLAEGEPTAQVARVYDLKLSSLHRHRSNCLRLPSSGAIKKEAARGSAAIALLPSKEALNGSYSDLIARIDRIAAQAQAEGSLAIALNGLNAIRHTLDCQARLAGHTQPGSTQVNVGVQTQINTPLQVIVERVVKAFDNEPELKARIAQALVEVDNEQSA